MTLIFVWDDLWLPGALGNVLVKSYLSPRSRYPALRQVNTINKNGPLSVIILCVNDVSLKILASSFGLYHCRLIKSQDSLIYNISWIKWWIIKNQETKTPFTNDMVLVSSNQIALFIDQQSPELMVGSF